MASIGINGASAPRHLRSGALLPSTDDEENASDPTHFGPVRHGPHHPSSSGHGREHHQEHSLGERTDEEFFFEHSPTGFMPERSAKANAPQHK